MMANLSQMLGIIETGGNALRQGVGTGMDRNRQALLDEQDKKERAARLGLVDLQTKGAQRELDLATQGDTESAQMVLGTKERLQQEIDEFSKTAQTPEDKEALSKAKDNLRLLNAGSKWTDPEKLKAFAVGPNEIKKQIVEQATKKTREGEMFGLEKNKTQAEIAATNALTGQRVAETGKTQKETSLLGMPKPEDKEASFNQEGKLRTEFVNQTKDFAVVKDAYKKINAVAKKPSAANDISLVYGFMKLNDPGSTVREGEFATAQNAGGIPDRVRSMYNKALSGERLADSVRKDFVSSAQTIYDQQKTSYDTVKNNFSQLSKQYGLDPSRVAIDIEGPQNTVASDDDLINKFVGGGNKSFTPSWKKTGKGASGSF